MLAQAIDALDLTNAVYAKLQSQESFVQILLSAVDLMGLFYIMPSTEDTCAMSAPCQNSDPCGIGLKYGYRSGSIECSTQVSLSMRMKVVVVVRVFG